MRDEVHHESLVFNTHDRISFRVNHGRLNFVTHESILNEIMSDSTFIAGVLAGDRADIASLEVYWAAALAHIALLEV